MNPPQRLLVICLRRLGDVLLATPLIRSLKQAYPNAEIDALVFAPTAGVLAGNPDLHEVIAMPKQGQLALLRRLWRRYDLAVAVTNSDRAHYAAWIASDRRAAVGSLNTRWKHWLLKTIVIHDPARLHTVVQGLLLADALGIARVPEVVPPRPADDSVLDAVLGSDWRHRPYAVLHPQPMYRYKAWTDDGWRALIRWLAAQGLRVVISGGPAEHERAAVSSLLARLDLPLDLPDDSVIDVSGRLPFAALTPMIEAARLFVGPDTSVTHLAAACNTPTLALFGPSSPVTWGPWPQGWDGEADSPWRLAVPFQRIGATGILQGDHGRQIGCIPCLQEGCERHTASPSDCLDRMTAARVIAAAAQLLGSRAPA